MAWSKGCFDGISTEKLKEEYISLCFGKMIYGVDTDSRRHKISDEIERRERERAFNNGKWKGYS